MIHGPAFGLKTQLLFFSGRSSSESSVGNFRAVRTLATPQRSRSAT